MTALSRRHVLAGAGATLAAAALPAAAVAAEQVTYMDPTVLAWRPECCYVMREIVMVANRFHVVMVDHMSGDTPSDRYLGRPLYIGADGRLVEESA